MSRTDDIKYAVTKNVVRQTPISQELNLYGMLDSFRKIQESCEDVRWMDDDTLVDILGEELTYDFKLQYSDLCSDCMRFDEEIQDYLRIWTLDGDNHGDSYFDALWAAAGCEDVGWYDEDASDFVPLYGWTAEYAERVAKVRIDRLTKAKIIELVGDSIWLVRTYLGIKFRYQMLSGIFDLIRERGSEMLSAVKGIEDKWSAWDNARENHDEIRQERELDRALAELPDRVWIE